MTNICPECNDNIINYDDYRLCRPDCSKSQIKALEADAKSQGDDEEKFTRKNNTFAFFKLGL